jgi:hypothetical protein
MICLSPSQIRKTTPVIICISKVVSIHYWRLTTHSHNYIIPQVALLQFAKVLLISHCTICCGMWHYNSISLAE